MDESEETLEVYEGQEPYIFISHSSEDMSALRPLLSAMSRVGFRFWYDGAGIQIGDDLHEKITERISECAVFMTFLSHSSMDFSRSTWCKNEFILAKEKAKFIFPVLLGISEQDIPGELTLTTGKILCHKAKDFQRAEDLAEFMCILNRHKECVSCKGGLSAETFDCPKTSKRVKNPPETLQTSPERVENPVRRVFDVDSIFSGVVSFIGVVFCLWMIRAYFIHILPLLYYNPGDNIPPLFAILYRCIYFALFIFAIAVFLLMLIAVRKMFQCFFVQPKFLIQGHSLTIEQGNTPKVLWISALEREDIHAITLTDDVKNIDLAFFDCCPSLEEIDVSYKNPQYMGIKGVLFDRNTLELLRYPKKRSDELYQFPADTRSIRSGAFDGCKKLKGVAVPLAEIGERAFYGCDSLTRAVLAEGVRKIGAEAFSGCLSLREIQIPDSVYEIQERAFKGCQSLSSVKVPERIHIYPNAFDAHTHVTRRQFA